MHTYTIRGLKVLLTLLTILSAGCAQQTDKKAEKTAEGAQSTIMDAPKTLVVIESSLGTMEAELYAEDAPQTVANFIGLAEQKYYDGVTFHRVSKGFRHPGGRSDRHGNGREDVHRASRLPDELNPATAVLQGRIPEGRSRDGEQRTPRNGDEPVLHHAGRQSAAARRNTRSLGAWSRGWRSWTRSAGADHAGNGSE